MEKSKKDLIKDAGVTVISQLGFHAATTDKIALEAGVSVGTVYNYFRQKEEILEYIFFTELSKRKNYYDTIKDQDISVMDKLRKLLVMHFAEVAKEPAVGQILVRERRSPEKFRLQGVLEFIEGVPRFIQSLLDQAVDGGEIRPCNTGIVAAAIFGSLEAVVSKAVFEEDRNVQTEILITAPDELLDLYMRGLRKA